MPCARKIACIHWSSLSYFQKRLISLLSPVVAVAAWRGRAAPSGGVRLGQVATQRREVHCVLEPPRRDLSYANSGPLPEKCLRRSCDPLVEPCKLEDALDRGGGGEKWTVGVDGACSRILERKAKGSVERRFGLALATTLLRGGWGAGSTSGAVPLSWNARPLDRPTDREAEGPTADVDTIVSAVLPSRRATFLYKTPAAGAARPAGRPEPRAAVPGRGVRGDPGSGD
ncbi:hypothetical protein THAOC_11025, partial [Thalassiosira oceanica]